MTYLLYICDYISGKSKKIVVVELSERKKRPDTPNVTNDNDKLTKNRNRSQTKSGDELDKIDLNKTIRIPVKSSTSNKPKSDKTS